MRLVRIAMLLAMTLFSGAAYAQEQRGSIEGLIKDSSGAVLPGVTVALSSATGAKLETVSDAQGVYRFPSLAPGVYTVNAALQGFRPGNVEGVQVALGQVKKVDFALGLANLSENVNVTAESPLVDVRQSARQTNIRAEQIDLLPKGRDFTTLVTQAPGANNEAKLGGLSIDGASAGENRYIIDGIETTNIQTGISGKNLIADFVEEVQVKSSGYTAEYGGATGGVVNAITKSGTNNFHGSALFNWEGDKLSGGQVPAAGTTDTTIATGIRNLRLNPSNSSLAEYIKYPEDSFNRIEPGFSLGGPVAQNRAWFFGAYQPALTTTERSVDANTSSNPIGAANSNTRKAQVQYATANVTSQMSPSLRSRLAFNNSWARTKGLLPTLNATDPTGSDYAKTSTFPNWSLSGNADWTVSPRMFVGVRAGYYLSDQYDTNVTEVPRYNWTTTNNVGYLDVPVSLQRGTGFSNVLSNNKVEQDKQTRLNFQADSTIYGNLAGAHQVKFGFQADRLGNAVSSGEARPRVTLRWNARLSGNTAACSGVTTAAGVCRGTYGYYSVRSQDVDPSRGFITFGDVSMNVFGFFVQDAWTINNKLTINAGIRTEREQVPYYAPGENVDGVVLPATGIEFGYADKMAPRVGFAYDLRGDGRTKAFASWGIFYDIFKLELPRGSFGGDRWLEYYYTLDTFDWPNLLASASCPPACPGTLMRTTDFRHISVGSSAIEPDLKPMKQQEATAGIEHQINAVMSASIRYVHKQIDRAIEDTQTATLDADGNEIYIIANPGEGLASPAFRDANGNVLATVPKPVRDYDSLEFALEKRLANRWFLRGSYLWSRLHGNYPGLSQSDENGRTSPNVGRLYDYPMMMFGDGGQPVYGPLPTDRPNQFKAQFIYQAPFGTSLGLNQYVASGLPVTREIGVYPGNNLPVQYLGRGSDGRTPTYSQTDMVVQHDFRLAGDRRLQLSFNVLNLFNQDTAIARFSTYQQVNGVTPLGPDGTEEAFYRGTLNLADLIVTQGVAQDARFLKDSSFQAPIQARFGVKFLF
ncbi:MAG TPA: carboxypeptidase regulatory-like domain-containing protein [Vicinamibacterales bacterium]|nr:carboxypeptidase regulatory-like domain-containing protein [Vicinamibacterales bacterium]